MAANGIRYSPIVNGLAYSWSTVTLVVAGVIVKGVTDITYEKTQDKEDTYGAGQYQVNRGYGNIKCSASITLYADEVRAIEAAAGGSIMDIPAFDILVQYVASPTKNVNDRLKNCEFKNEPYSIKQNDMNQEVKLDLILSDIEHSYV